MRQAAAARPDELEMRIAVLGRTGQEEIVRTWQAALACTGVPHVTLALARPEHRDALLRSLRDRRVHALILADGALLDTALDPAQRRAVATLSGELGIRRLIAYAYPAPGHGLTPADASGALDDVPATLTPAGRAVFPYLRDRIVIDAGTWGHPAAPYGAGAFTPLLTDPHGAVLLGIHGGADGEAMVQTMAAHHRHGHAQLLRRGQLAWLTRGAHVGHDRHYLSLHVDDVLLANRMWDVSRHAGDGDPAATARMTARDAARAARWSRARGLRLDLACNGHGSSERPGDPLLGALLDEGATFGWLNHTYGHRDLDHLPLVGLVSEIEENVAWARGAGVPMEPATLVTGAHTGLANLAATPPREENVALAGALRVSGVRFIACDASRPHRGPGPGVVGPGEPFRVGASLAVPRHPTGVPFDAAFRRQAVDRHGTESGARRGWAEIVAAEAARMLGAMLANDPRPHFFHQSNLIGGDNGDDLLREVIDAVLDRFREVVPAAPIVQPTFSEIGDLLARRQVFAAALRGGTVTVLTNGRRIRIVNSGPEAVAVPLTGVAAGPMYAGARSGWVSVAPGEAMMAVARTGE
jgi:hypothetical protein